MFSVLDISMTHVSQSPNSIVPKDAKKECKVYRALEASYFMQTVMPSALGGLSQANSMLSPTCMWMPNCSLYYSSLLRLSEWFILYPWFRLLMPTGPCMWLAIVSGLHKRKELLILPPDDVRTNQITLLNNAKSWGPQYDSEMLVQIN